jgi:hypothetical protein
VHPTRDIETSQVSEFAQRYNANAAEQATWRTRAEVTRFFDGTRVLEPGVVVLVPAWRPRNADEAATHAAMWGGVALKD